MQRTYKTGACAGRQSRPMSSEIPDQPVPDQPVPDQPVSDQAPVRFDTKIAVLLRDDLETWQRLNVTSFLVSGIGPMIPEVIGDPYEDADGTAYLPMFRQPVLVFEGTKEVLKAARARALARALPRAVFTSDLFATGNDRDNRAAVRAVGAGELDLVGLAVYGPRNGVDKVVKGARMHP
ncbi:DUF2000 domain-containing protein [Streptomyces europaeiscabiei]|uniref:DUF2000 domain-containing protein n=2 Tax=Streptomyces europaeiscabiei TaxID=146819 RepID=A0AAJ2Q0T1_9ACTN|nr:DUF2000 domain-containing protein [Streptomyces europaeiscabiei]MDX3136763.1 DUF2000 domain-containing protein [Streptomyces europaeiscabiei]